MANFLINGMKSRVGGGKVILDTYLRLLVESAPTDQYFILTPDRAAYAAFESDRISVIDVPGWAHSNMMTLPLYRFVFPRLLKRYQIDAILNFGDIVIPTDVPQVYNFDWPIAVYPEFLQSDHLGRAEGLAYRLKLRFFEAYLTRATLIMAQTKAMRDRLAQRYRLDNVQVVPAAVSPVSPVTNDDVSLPQGRRYLAYPASYYPHKNIDILIDVAKLLKARGSDVGIVTTLAGDEHPGAAAFLAAVRQHALDDMIVNVGRLPSDRIPGLYRACSGLLMPTLLETFGLPYVEAMRHHRPILTSDRDFAHAVCADAAAYFEPTSAPSIVETIESVLGSDDRVRQLVGCGKAQLAQMWSWHEVFAKYQELLSQVGFPATDRQREFS